MLLKFINNSISKIFEQDFDSVHLLHEIEGQTILIKLTDVQKQFLVVPSNTTINVNEFQSESSGINSNTIIHATIYTMLRLALGADYQTMLNNGTLQIKGDVELANQMRAIFKNIDVDWEEIASKYVGDSVAYQMGVFSTRIIKYKQKATENFRLDVSEYLQEESRIVPTKIEINRFLNNVDALDADIDRLEMRTKRLLEACSK